jgi:hypothetical protein
MANANGCHIVFQSMIMDAWRHAIMPQADIHHNNTTRRHRCIAACASARLDQAGCNKAVLSCRQCCRCPPDDVIMLCPLRVICDVGSITAFSL